MCSKFFKPLLIFLVIFTFFLFPKEILAFSFAIVNADPSIVSSKEQEVSVGLSITDLPSGDSYFRVGIESGGSYVGYIKNNNGDWVKLKTLTEDEGGYCFNYFKVSTSVVSLTLSLKIGSDIDLANGVYNLKAHRFTSTCKTHSPSSETAPVAVTLSLPTPTPSPTPDPTAEPTATPTLTPTATPTSTKTPTPKATPAESETPSNLVLGLQGEEGSPSPVASVEAKNKIPLISFIFIFLGLGFIGGAGYLVFRKSKGYNGTHGENKENS